MTSISLEPILSQAHAHLRVWRDRPAGQSAQPFIAHFLDDIYALGSALSGAPELAHSDALRAFLAETEPGLEDEHVSLLFYPGSLIGEFERIWEYDEWEQLCQRRSGLQFFIDLYRDTSFAPFADEIETEDLDETLREWGLREGFLPSSKVDPGIPHSHWWWRAPEAPPVVIAPER